MTQHDNLINGQWVPGKAYAPNLNPSDLSDVVGEYVQGDAADVDAAVAAAKAAFRNPGSQGGTRGAAGA